MGSTGIVTAPIKRVPRNQRLPLSFAQERFWFLARLNPESPVYNGGHAFRLVGPIDIDALRDAVQDIVSRHEGLRTAFTNHDGGLAQVVSPEPAVPFSILDLRSVPEGEREGRALRHAREEFVAPFDLAHGPLLRVCIFRLSDTENLFLSTLHHIVSDGWPASVFLRELKSFYEARVTGNQVQVPELAVQFADFAVWERSWLQGDDLKRELAFWKDALPVPHSMLNLPLDRPRPAALTYRGDYCPVEIPEPLLAALKQFSRHQRMTLFMTMLAAYQTLLHRLSGQNDIIVGTPTGRRNRREVEGVIGCFINTLPLRADFSDDPTFRSLLECVRKTCLAAYAHQDVPFEKLVEEFQPKRSLNHSPLFQAMLILQPHDKRQITALCGASLTPVRLHNGSAKFDLTLDLRESADGLAGGFEYSTDLFDRSTIARWADHFVRLLEAIVANPDARVGALPLLNSPQRERLLVEWNPTGPAPQREVCAHELISERARARPEAVAVEFAGAQLSYGELNRRANRLAHHLRTVGVGPEILVGVCVERSLEMVVGLLGVLKAGGAYVPLDPSYPQQRLAHMLSDSDAGVLLSQSHLIEHLSEHDAATICLDTFDWSDTRLSEDDPDSGTTSASLAYVIYTSGSTGEPKGVEITHGSLTNFLGSMAREPGLAAGDRFLAVTTLSFDISGLELYLPLTVGACVEIATRDDAMDGFRLAARLAQGDVTAMQATPATWRLLVEAGWAGDDRLKMMCGGEALTRDLADQLLERCGELWNLYGPTETTIWSSVHRVVAGAGPVPIGHPIANTQLHVLDPAMQPVPIGVPGELYIGGAGVARGYWRRPELTAERFVPDAFGENPELRLYRTGDLGRRLVNGDLEVLGRLDHQVKLRGFRIELQEIETALNGHTEVSEAVVALFGNDSAEPHLVAYFVPYNWPAPAAADLQALLRQKLPDYMVPTAYVPLEELPCTPNGKLDRSALPTPDGTQQDHGVEYRAPRNKLERELAEIWQQVLGIPRAGIHDDFFDQGGHSLLAVRLMSKIEAKVGRNIPLIELFQGRTIEHIAGIIGASHNGVSSSAVVALQPNGSKPPFFAGGSHPRYAEIARRLGQDQPFYRLDVYGLQSQRLAEGLKAYQRIEDMAAQFIKELRAVQPVGPYFLSGGCEGGIVAFEMALQLQRQGEKIACLVIWEIPAPGRFSGPFRRRSAIARVVNQLRSLLGKGSLRGMSLREFWVLIKHEYTEYQIFRAVAYYVPTERYGGKLTIARTAGHKPSNGEDISMGWSELGADGADVFILPGNHQNWLENHAGEFGDLLDSCLAAARHE